MRSNIDHRSWLSWLLNIHVVSCLFVHELCHMSNPFDATFIYVGTIILCECICHFSDFLDVCVAKWTRLLKRIR
jgi:hypothetical protein